MTEKIPVGTLLFSPNERWYKVVASDTSKKHPCHSFSSWEYIIVLWSKPHRTYIGPPLLVTHDYVKNFKQER